MAEYIKREDAIAELRKSHSIGEAHRRLLQMEAIDIVQCKDCKKNPKDTWFGCPMSHLTEKQRPETAWCWKGSGMKLNNEQEVVCQVFRRKDATGHVHCFECPMQLHYQDCVCLKNVSKEHAIKDYDWDGSPYPRLKAEILEIEDEH